MGRHSRSGRRRSLAPWLIITTAVVVVAAVITAVFLVASNRRPALAYCTGTVVLHVVAAPAAGPAVIAAAAAYDATRPVARSTCVETTVAVTAGAATAQGLIDGWRNRRAPAPALWVADSPADVDAVQSAAPEVVAGRSTKPVASTPVVLAARTADAADLAGLTWVLQRPASWPAGRLFAVAFPDPATNPASVGGLQAVFAAARPAGAGAGSALTRPEVDRLAGSVPLPVPAAGTGRADSPATTAAALATLAGGAGGFAAVPATEAAIAELDQGGSPAVTAVYPGGPTVVVQLLLTPVAGSWVDPTATSAAAGFSAYLAGPAGRQILADHGLRVPDTAPVRTPAGVDPDHPIDALTDAAPPVRSALADAYAHRFPTATAAGSGSVSSGSLSSGAGSTSTGSTGTGSTSAG